MEDEQNEEREIEIPDDIEDIEKEFKESQESSEEAEPEIPAEPVPEPEVPTPDVPEPSVEEPEVAEEKTEPEVVEPVVEETVVEEKKEVVEEKPEPVEEKPAEEPEVVEEKVVEPVVEEKSEEEPKKGEPKIFALRTTANREDQVMDFLTSNIKKKKLPVYTVVRPHGMRGYIFVEALDKQSAEQAAFNVPYARGILPKEIDYKEIEHMLEQVKREVDIRKNDIVEIIVGPFKREQAKVTRIDKTKEEVVVELLEAAVPIPMTLKLDTVKVIRRDTDEQPEV